MTCSPHWTAYRKRSSFETRGLLARWPDAEPSNDRHHQLARDRPHARLDRNARGAQETEVAGVKPSGHVVTRNECGRAVAVPIERHRPDVTPRFDWLLYTAGVLSGVTM